MPEAFRKASRGRIADARVSEYRRSIAPFRKQRLCDSVSCDLLHARLQDEEIREATFVPIATLELDARGR